MRFLVTIAISIISILAFKPLAADDDLKAIASEFNDPTAFYLMAEKIVGVSESPADFLRAKPHYERAANLGHAKAAYKLGKAYYNGDGVAKSLMTAAYWLMPAAQNGISDAQYLLGMVYFTGEGKELPVYYEKAYEWLSLAAKDAHKDALYQSGLMLLKGLGVKADTIKAKELLTRARNQDHAHAASLLAKLSQQTLDPLSGQSSQQKVHPNVPGTAAPDSIHISNNKNKVDEKVHRLQEAADEGDAQAQFDLAQAYRNGRHNLPKDMHVAILWYSTAANNGHREAQFQLATIYYSGEHTARDLEEATHWYQVAARQGHEGANTMLALIKKANAGVLPVPHQDDIETAAERGDAGAQYKLGLMHLHGSDYVLKDERTALRWFLKAANAGHTEAQFQVGLSFYKPGDTLTEDARHWFGQAAHAGHSEAQYLIAEAHYNSGDYDEAHTWYLKASNNSHVKSTTKMVGLFLDGKVSEARAAKIVDWLVKNNYKGNAELQYRLGVYYLDKPTLSSTAARTLELMRNAANSGHVMAQYKLGEMYKTGTGVEKQYDKSAHWFERAALQGHADAQYELAEIFHLDSSFPDNQTQARKWYAAAAAQGHRQAIIKLDELIVRVKKNEK